MKPKELLPFYRFKIPPSLKFPVESIKAALNTPDKFGNTRDTKKKLEDIGKSAVGLFPAGSQIKRTAEGIQAVKEGGSYDKAGNLQFKQGQTLPKKIQSIVFGKYSSDEAQNYFTKKEENSKELKKIKPIYKEVQKLASEGREEEALSIINELSDAEYELYKKYKKGEKAKETVAGKKEILPIYTKVQALKETSPEEARAIVDGLTDEQYEYYKLVKKDNEAFKKAEAGELPEFGDTPHDDKNIIEIALTYANAIGRDPVTAFNRIFTKQRIRRVDNGVIIVERLDLKDSQAIKEERGGNISTLKLDHTLPLQLGGSNAEDNLKLVDNEIWASYTPIENYLGKKLRNKEIKKKEAQDLILKFKAGEITAEEVLNYK